MPIILDPAEIEKKSFEIIEQLLKGRLAQGPEKSVVMRVVHATADTDFADSMVFSEGAVEAGVSAIKSACRILTDVKMLRSGISPTRPGGQEPYCYISDPEIFENSKKWGTTRAAAAFRKAAGDGLLDGAIVAVGNAPTALYELIDLVKAGAKPALIVGVPVGFVGAAESKEALLELKGAPFITSRGRKGGSPVAAAIINAIIKLAI